MLDEKKIKIALVHDFLVQYGGAERVLEVFCEMYPDAPIYTLLYDKQKMRGKFADRVIYTSFLKKFPKFLRKRYKYLLPLMPTAPEIFDLREFDLVISSSGAWSKGIVTRLNTVHISYTHSPMRFAWDTSNEYLEQQKKNKGINFCTRILMSYIRVWDKLAADRPDYLISNSKYTQARVEKYYRRESEVIYPPVNFELNLDSERISLKSNEKYFLVISRLSPYKKVDVIVEVFNELGLPLIVIGAGQQEKYLKEIAKNNIKILGWQTDKQLREYYSNARAFIFPCVDDFGIVSVEAMAHGIPVLALRKGGALETVIEGVTGEFFDSATPSAITDSVKKLIENEKKYDKQAIMKRAQDFSKERFIREIKKYVDRVLN